MCAVTFMEMFCDFSIFYFGQGKIQTAKSDLYITILVHNSLFICLKCINKTEILILMAFNWKLSGFMISVNLKCFLKRTFDKCGKCVKFFKKRNETQRSDFENKLNLPQFSLSHKYQLITTIILFPLFFYSI